MFAAVEIIADTIYNSTYAQSDIEVEKANVLKELEVSFAACAFFSRSCLIVNVVTLSVLFL